MEIRDRIRELRRVPASQLRPSSKNWRTHPKQQSDALQTMLQEIGFAGALLARETAEGELELIDGHLRAVLASDDEVPLLILDVTEEEADQLLATYDAIGQMAGINAEQVAALHSEIEARKPAMKKLLKQLSKQLGRKSKPAVKTTQRRTRVMEIPESYELVVTCQDEDDQRSVYERLAAEGYECRVLTM